MNDVGRATSAGSTVSGGAILKRLFVIAYVTAVAVAMFGWVSAFWWITIRLARWLMA
jgi:hypothetical protein